MMKLWLRETGVWLLQAAGVLLITVGFMVFLTGNPLCWLLGIAGLLLCGSAVPLWLWATK